MIENFSKCYALVVFKQPSDGYFGKNYRSASMRIKRENGGANNGAGCGCAYGDGKWE